MMDLRGQTTAIAMATDNDDAHSLNSGVGSEISFSKAEAQKRKQDEEAERSNIAKMEDKAIRCLRVAVFLLIVITAAVVSRTTYVITRDDEVDDFHNEFRASAGRLVEAFHSHIDVELSSVDSMASTITSWATKTGSNFPNVTLPDMAIRGDNTRVLADATALRWQPLVTEKNRAGWEAYSRSWETYEVLLEASLMEEEQRALQDAMYNVTDGSSERRGRVLQESGDWKSPLSRIHGVVDGAAMVLPPGSGPYVPLWQTSPAFTPDMFGQINFDSMTHPTSSLAVRACIESGLAVVDRVSVDSDGSILAFELASGQYRYNKEELVSDPFTVMEYPVFNNFDEDREVVGAIGMSLYWRLMFMDILSDKASVFVVLTNSYNQTLSYRVDGMEASFLGFDDYHNAEFDHLKVSEDVFLYTEEHARPETRSFTTVGLNGDFGRYYISVYPTDEMEDHFLTRGPFLITTVVVCVFAFTTCVFLLYDMIVARRQKIVLSRAVKSGAIVSSLFPEQIRDRLFEEGSNEKKKKEVGGGGKAWLAKDDKLQQLMDPQQDANYADGGDGIDRPNATTGGGKSSRPIAEHYEDSTILFADIVGFAQWSAARLPEQVFDLLETLYRAYDACALTLGVFKIETIGDCYLAVTGVPLAQDDHAMIMVRFAHEILRKTSEMMHRLSETLGPDTLDLGLRIGLHSGPVTAGVLRGQKSRFQLFGDSVNTASRIETSGMKGRIHASESTAHCLITQGKSSWVIPRKEKIKAKGKGELQTYWIQMKKSSNGGMDGQSTTDGTTPDILNYIVPPAEEEKGKQQEQARGLTLIEL